HRRRVERLRRAHRNFARARPRRRERAGPHEERAERLSRDIDLEGWSDAVTEATARTLVSRASRPALRKALLESGHHFPTRLTVTGAEPFPERVLQVGEGNFLRAFVDWRIDAMNARGLFGGRVVIVQPIARGAASALNAQDNLYTVVLRGIEHGQVRE